MNNEQETVDRSVENHVEEIIDEGREYDVIEDQRNGRSKRYTRRLSLQFLNFFLDIHPCD